MFPTQALQTVCEYCRDYTPTVNSHDIYADIRPPHASGFVISDTAFVLFGSPGHVVVVFGGQRISHRVQSLRLYYSLPAMSASSALIRIAT
jgi:hypothetical protein